MQSDQVVSKRARQTGHTTSQAVKPSRSIVLIEEHQQVRNELAHSLKTQLGFRLAQVTPYLPSRPEGLMSLDPKVILIGLPQRSVTTTQTLLQHIEFWVSIGISIVVLVTYIDPEEQELMIRAGVYAYVHKMIDVKRLGKVISMALWSGN